MQDKNNSNFNKLLKNTGILIGGDVSASMINVITLIIVTNSLGIEKYGMMILIVMYAQTIDKLVNFQSWQALIKFGSDSIENQTGTLKSYIKQAYILDFVSAFFGTLLGVLLVDYIGSWLEWDSEIITYAKVYCLFILFNLTGAPTGILRLFNEFKVFSYNKIQIATLKLIIGVALLVFNFSFELFIYLNLSAEILGFILLFSSALKVLNKQNLTGILKSKISNSKSFFSFTVYSNLISTFDVPVKQLDVFIINTVISTEAVGVYRIIKQIVAIISKLIDPIYQAVYPNLTSMCAKKDYSGAIEVVKKIAKLVAITGIPVVFLASITSKWWIAIFFGELVANYYIELSVLLILQLISVIFIGIHPLFIALGHIKINVYIIPLSNLLYFFIAYFLGLELGILGIILAYGFQFLSVITIKLWIISRQNKLLFRENLF